MMMVAAGGRLRLLLVGQLGDERVRLHDGRRLLPGQRRGEPARDTDRRFGLTVEPITPELADRLGTETGRGVVVRSVVPGGPAHAAGLRPGDVILRVGSSDVTDPVDFRAALRREEPGTGLRLLVRRDTGTIFMVLEAPE